jgi:hypothetical protein
VLVFGVPVLPELIVGPLVGPKVGPLVGRFVGPEVVGPKVRPIKSSLSG